VLSDQLLILALRPQVIQHHFWDLIRRPEGSLVHNRINDLPLGLN